MIDTLDLKSNEQYVRVGSLSDCAVRREVPPRVPFAGIAQLVEHDLAKVGVASSLPD
jgi:hypothetical protein